MKLVKYVLIPVALFFIPFFIPQSTDDIMGVASTFIESISGLFAIIGGFFIANAAANYLRLQSLLSQERGALMTLYTTAKSVGKSEEKMMADAIDAYLIASLDNAQLDYVFESQNEFDAVIATADNVRDKDAQSEGTHQDSIDGAVKDLYEATQEIEIVSKRDMTQLHWIVAYLAAFGLAISVLGILNGTWFASLVAGISFLLIYAFLVLLDQVDSNAFFIDKLGFRNYLRVLHTIGKLPYYPEHALKTLNSAALKKPYRLGKVSRDKKSRTIEVVE